MAYNRQRPIDLLTRDDLDTLLAACGRSITGVRNRALLAVMYFSGVRTAEALALRPADVKVNADGTATLNVRSGKGGKQRHVTLAAPGLPTSPHGSNYAHSASQRLARHRCSARTPPAIT